PAERADQAKSSDAAERAATAYLDSDEGRTWDAYRAWKDAADAAGEAKTAFAANVHAGFGRFLANLREFPEVHRKLRAKEQFAAAVAAWPHHNSGAVRLASYFDEDDHPEKAVAALREQIKALPTSRSWFEMATICRKRQWEHEAVDAANEAA